MKLKCSDHRRRAVVLPSGAVVHRQDGSECPAEWHLTIGDRVVTPEMVAYKRPGVCLGGRLGFDLRHYDEIDRSYGPADDPQEGRYGRV